MKTLRTVIKEKIFEIGEERTRVKKSFWCTESETNQLELFFKFKGIKPTNPMKPETKFGLNIRKKVEDVILSYLEDIIIKPKRYEDEDGTIIENPEQHRVKMERLGVPITGYMDAVIKERVEVESGADGVNGQWIELPVEIKTSYGPFAEAELKRCEPKLGYLKQLGQYMDFMGVNKGYLFQLHFSNNGFIPDDFYQFALIRNGNKFKCGNIEFDIYEDIYKRYERIWNNYIVPNIEPPSEYKYKYKLDEIDWRRIPKSKVTNARNNRAVIGDWQIQYSDWKDLIIQKEGTQLGYTDQELNYIKDCTKGFTSW